MRSLLLVLCLTCTCHARRVQPVVHEDGARTQGSEDNAVRHMGAISDADLRMTNLKHSTHDSSLLADHTEGSSSHGSLTNLLLTLSPISAHAAPAKAASATPRGGNEAVMRYRFEDSEDKRLSKGGSGGGMGTRAKGPVDKYAGLTDSQRARAEKVEAYLDNDLEAADGTFGKVLAGCMLFALLGGLIAIFMYYGADGLASATKNQRAVRGM